MTVATLKFRLMLGSVWFSPLWKSCVRQNMTRKCQLFQNLVPYIQDCRPLESNWLEMFSFLEQNIYSLFRFLINLVLLWKDEWNMTYCHLGLLLPGRLVHPHPLLFRLQQTKNVRKLSVSLVNYCVKNYKKYETVTVGLFTVGPLPHSALWLMSNNMYSPPPTR